MARNNRESATFGAFVFISKSAHRLLPLSRTVTSSRHFIFEKTLTCFLLMVNAQVFAPPQIHLADSYLLHFHFSQEVSQPTATFSVLSALASDGLG